MDKRTSRSRAPSFDVTCIIGTVSLEDSGAFTPGEAAMLLIARHDAPGTYTFPAPEGGTTEVTVEHREEVTA